MSEKNMEQHSENHSNEKLEAFEEQQPIMEKIKEMGMVEYVKTLPGLPDAFNLEKHKFSEDNHKCACCMDERTPFGGHSAGSGILLSEKEFNKFFELSGIDSISSHTGCGAAKIAAKIAGYTGNPDDFGREWAEKKAKEKGVPHIHIEVARSFHYARVCYYDGTGKFNYAGVEGLPAGFVIGRKNMSKEASLAEAGVAKDIIFGDHGFGKELLNKENPFMFIAVADTEKETEKLKEELAKFTKGFGDSVVVDGFTFTK